LFSSLSLPKPFLVTPITAPLGPRKVLCVVDVIISTNGTGLG